MSFVTNDLDLVLFLKGRNRIKFNCRQAVRSYIERRRALYARSCYKEHVEETATKKKYRHIIGADKHRDWCGAFERPLKCKRDLVTESPWKLAPNRYDVPSELFCSFKGAGGAYWPKLHTNKSIIEKKIERRPRYNVTEFRKGASWLFPGNARDRRPALRCMINSLTSCYRHPKEPGPTHYFPKLHLLERNISELTKTEPPNPHLFHDNSCVPAKLMQIIPRHISMDPTPGRYEIRYPFICACSPKLIYMPGLIILTDRMKRNRFRHLPYERIKSRLYCDPEWRHVIGHGFRYLFRTTSRGQDLKLKAAAKGSENLRLKLFHDQRYMNMITRPERTVISWRLEPMPELPITIKYNSLTKRVIRKQLRMNKKIAFNSGQERWTDGYRLPMLTVAQQQAAKMLLPIDRQLRDQPTMRVSLSDIHSKLMHTPKHMQPSFKPELRKRLFKFLPLPGAKVLVTEQDTRPEMKDGKYLCDNFYGREIIPENFFMDAATRKRINPQPDVDKTEGDTNTADQETEKVEGDSQDVRASKEVRVDQDK